MWPWYHLPWGRARVIDHNAQQFFLCSWHPNSSSFHDWWERFFKTTSRALVFSSGSFGQELINMSLQRFIQQISSVIKMPGIFQVDRTILKNFWASDHHLLGTVAKNGSNFWKSFFPWKWYYFIQQYFLQYILIAPTKVDGKWEMEKKVVFEIRRDETPEL